jgi:hypothetical protein
LLFVGSGHRHWVARIAQLLELNALNHAAAMDIEAGDNADRKHGEVYRGRKTVNLVKHYRDGPIVD